MGRLGTTWKYIQHDGQTLHWIGLKADGSLYNPNGYDETIVRAAIAGSLERRHQRRSEAAKKAAVTRAKRKERKIYEVVARLKADGKLVPGEWCEICGKHLDDPSSIGRGIGSDCWQFILTCLKPDPEPVCA